LLDIGTTTISGSILDVSKNKILSSGLVLNRQSQFGDDLVSRIGFALTSRRNPPLLQKKISFSVNSLIGKLLADSLQKRKDIQSVLCVANSAMHHLFLGIDTSPLITPPYRPSQKAEITVYAKMLGLKLIDNVSVTFLPNIEGFVGSDALCVILACNIYKDVNLKLAIDIGTNGEVILGNKERILVASTAAGPAFEARYVKNGMPAIKGAIKSVKIRKRRIEYSVIGRGTPKGIAGSGLIDACYEIFRTGLMDKSGKMKEKEFIIYKRGKKKISITQNDIRKLQLAKAAIFAAIKVLLRRYGAESADIDQVLLTGSFGSCLNTKSIAGIGLIPKVGIRKVRYLKGGALEGLRFYATNPSISNHIPAVLSRIEHLPLLGQGFGEEFVSSLALE
jgi:uncharacterized 2Fe-2S/4Fe-4S cluster protein (DUF4445 family)